MGFGHLEIPEHVLWFLHTEPAEFKRRKKGLIVHLSPVISKPIYSGPYSLQDAILAPVALQAEAIIFCSQRYTERSIKIK